MLSDLLIILALVLLNGVFAMSEIEIVSSASRLGAALERAPLLAPYAGRGRCEQRERPGLDLHITRLAHVCPRKLEARLCQNCVRCPLKPQPNTVIYGHTPMHIVVAGGRLWRVRWCVSVCVAERDRNQFPSVLLQPLGHLSVQVESTVYRRVASPAKANCDVTVT